MFQRIKNWFNLLSRCRKYSNKLNQIDKLLNEIERENKELSKQTQELINKIDLILD